MTAVVRCWRDWLAERGGVGAAEVREGLLQVRLFLEQHGESRFSLAWDKINERRQKALADLVVDSKVPVSFFTSIMRDEAAPFEKREAAADWLLPYYHPKLSSIEARGGGKSHEERLEELSKLLGDD